MKTFTQVCAEVLENHKRFNSIKGADILVTKISAKELLDRAVILYEAECAKNSVVKPLSEAERQELMDDLMMQTSDRPSTNDIRAQMEEASINKSFKAANTCPIIIGSDKLFAKFFKPAQTFADDANPILAEQLWDIYAEAGGGKTFDGKPLPKFDDLGTQKTGWFQVADAVNAKLGFKLSKSETAPISAKPKPVDEPVDRTDIKFKELYIFGLNAGKDQKGTLKFINGSVLWKSLEQSSEILEFKYTSATTGDVRYATFLKSNISGYSWTEAD